MRPMHKKYRSRFAVLVMGLLLACSHPMLAQPVAPDYRPVFVDPVSSSIVRNVLPIPPDGSPAADSDVDMVLAMQTLRTDEQVMRAAADADRPAEQWASDTLGFAFSKTTHPLAYALFQDSRRDLSYAVDLAKNNGPQRKRPVLIDRRVRPALSYEGHHDNAWPSGRAAATRAWAEILSDLFPEQRAALMAAAQESAWLRVVGGVHYPSDLIAGYRLSDAFMKELRATGAYQERLAAARDAMVQAGRGNR